VECTRGVPTMASILSTSPVLQQLSSATLLSSLTSIVPSRLHQAIRSSLIAALQAGPLPQHVAFILDGNRRFARERGRPVVEGHHEGREALKRVRAVTRSSLFLAMRPLLKCGGNPYLNPTNTQQRCSSSCYICGYRASLSTLSRSRTTNDHSKKSMG
jgi:Putative undecaprenyl diphosphate synthase